MALLAISVLVHQDCSALRFYWLIRINCNSGILNNAIMQFSLLPVENESSACGMDRICSSSATLTGSHKVALGGKTVTELPPQPFQKPHTQFRGVESTSEIKGRMTDIEETAHRILAHDLFKIHQQECPAQMAWS